MDQRFEDLLLEYAQADHPDERERIEAALWKEFGRKKAVLVMDMSGFSRLTQKYGIVHYLSMVRRMQITTLPIIEKHGGQVVKYEADNCFAMFDEVLSAVEASIALNTAFDAMNLFTNEEFDIRISIGIDYGDVLLIGGPDYFGNTVNLASKLGEDVAGPGEIYVTETALNHIPDAGSVRGEKQELSISGITLNAMKLAYT
jgi:adenylate cyclase